VLGEESGNDAPMLVCQARLPGHLRKEATEENRIGRSGLQGGFLKVRQRIAQGQSCLLNAVVWGGELQGPVKGRETLSEVRLHPTANL